MRNALFISFLVNLQNIFRNGIIEIPVNAPLTIGDAAYWDELTQSLYFVSLFEPSARVCRYSNNENMVYCAVIEGGLAAGSIVPVKGKIDEFVVGLDLAIKVIKWDGRSSIAQIVRVVTDVAVGTTSVMNVATVASDGRYYTGNFNSKICGGVANSTLYSYTPLNGLNVVLTGMVMNQGLVFIDKYKKFYHLDGCSYRIVEYDWNPSTGQVSNARIVYQFESDVTSYFPVGLSADRRGFLYTAGWGSGYIYKINPRLRSLVWRMRLPALFLTSPTFGGKNLDEIFVLSSSLQVSLENGQVITPLSTANGNGALYKIVGTKARGFAGRRAIV